MKAIRFTPVPLPQEVYVPPCLVLIDRLVLRPVTAKVEVPAVKVTPTRPPVEVQK